jgi:hypothetical protein
MGYEDCYELAILDFLVVHDFLENLGVVVINLTIGSFLESFQEFGLDCCFEIGSNESFILTNLFSTLGLLLDRDYFVPKKLMGSMRLLHSLYLQSSDSIQHLSELGESLFALVDNKFVPVLEMLVDLLQGLLDY